MRRRVEATITVVLALAVFAAAGYVIFHKDPVKDAGQTPGFSLGATPSTSAASGSRTSTGGPTVFFLGDDYTASVGASAKTKGFVAALGQSLPITVRSASVVGGGYAKKSGDGQTYLSKIGDVVSAKPAVVVVTGGRNDTADDSGTLRADAKKLFATLHQKLPNAKLVAVAAFWGDSDHPSSLDDVDSAVKAGVQNAGGTFVDLDDPLHNHPEWMADDADPNDKGYAAIASALAAKLEPLLPTT